jgi:hypothetical protein
LPFASAHVFASPEALLLLLPLHLMLSLPSAPSTLCSRLQRRVQQWRSGYQLPERSREREAIDFIAFVLPVIFLSPFSSAKSHVKPRNHLNP